MTDYATRERRIPNQQAEFDVVVLSARREVRRRYERPRLVRHDHIGMNLPFEVPLDGSRIVVHAGTPFARPALPETPCEAGDDRLVPVLSLLAWIALDVENQRYLQLVVWRRGSEQGDRRYWDYRYRRS